MAESCSRIIITPEYLIDHLAHTLMRRYDTATVIRILAGFMLTEDDAHRFFVHCVATFKAAPDHPGKEKIIEAFQHLGEAYNQMTVFERERIRRELPAKLAMLIKDQVK